MWVTVLDKVLKGKKLTYLLSGGLVSTIFPLVAYPVLRIELDVWSANVAVVVLSWNVSFVAWKSLIIQDAQAGKWLIQWLKFVIAALPLSAIGFGLTAVLDVTTGSPLLSIIVASGMVALLSFVIHSFWTFRNAG